VALKSPANGMTLPPGAELRAAQYKITVLEIMAVKCQHRTYV
jgi:hypothetical protein